MGCFLVYFLRELKSSGVCQCWSRCACRAARTIGAEPPAPAKPALNCTACLGLSVGEPRLREARHKSRPAQSQTEAHRPGAVRFPIPRPSRPSREGGRESRALPPRQPRCSAHICTQARPRSCPRPPGAPALPAPREPAGSRGRAGGTSGNFEPCLYPSHPRGCREKTYPPGEGTGFSPVERRKRRRKGEAEARCRPGGCRAAERGRPPARSRRPPRPSPRRVARQPH